MEGTLINYCDDDGEMVLVTVSEWLHMGKVPHSIMAMVEDSGAAAVESS